MSPDFEELVGSDIGPAERARLERVHDLLVAAGPPPDFAPEVVAPLADVVEFPAARRRRAGALIAIAAALAIALFALGAAALDNGPAAAGSEVIAMHGTAKAPTASGSLEVLPVDSAGNWPMRFTVSGLAPASSGRPFELWLTRGGRSLVERLKRRIEAHERRIANRLSAPERAQLIGLLEKLSR